MKVTTSLFLLFLSATPAFLHAAEPAAGELLCHNQAGPAILPINHNQLNYKLGKALQSAAYQNDTRAVRSSLALNAPVNQQGSCGDTALHWAVLNNNNTIVTLLLEHGASMVITNNSGITPLKLAESSQNQTIISLFQSWQKYRAARLAFWMAADQNQPRFGAQSPARILSQEMVKEILQYLPPRDFEIPEVAVRVREFIVHSRRHDLVVERQDRVGGLDPTGCSEQMAGHRFG